MLFRSWGKTKRALILLEILSKYLITLGIISNKFIGQYDGAKIKVLEDAHLSQAAY